jgi:hypothetical protein
LTSIIDSFFRLLGAPSGKNAWLFWAVFGTAFAYKSCMFDIFTTKADGSPEFLISVSYLVQAQEIARGLSRIVPGGYFERVYDAEVLANWKASTAEARTN